MLVPVSFGLLPKKLVRVTIAGEQWTLVSQLREVSALDVANTTTMFATGDVRRLLQLTADLHPSTTNAKLGGYLRT